jgi:hypothetical protein
MKMKTRRVEFYFLCLTLVLTAMSVPALADHQIQRTLKLNPGGRFVLDSDAGSVTINGSSQSGANVVITSDRDDVESLFHFVFEDSGGTARVTARKTFSGHFGWPHNLNLHYEISVPNSTQLEVRTGGGSVRVSSIKGDSTLRTSGGSMEIADLSGELNAETSGGSIALREVTGNSHVETSGGSIEATSIIGALRGHTSGGSIRVSRVDGDVDVGTSGGPIRIDDAGGRVIARTSGGSVEVRFDRGNSKGGELETSGGSVRVALDPKVNLNIDATSSGGGVRSDLDITTSGRISTSSLHGSIGSGGAELRLHTDGGSVVIESRQ